MTWTLLEMPKLFAIKGSIHQKYDLKITVVSLAVNQGSRVAS
jgi:hypothetical protein